MPNSDRGAYLPPPEEPLTFDARRPVRGRAPMPMMLFVSAGILFLLVVGIVVILRSGLPVGKRRRRSAINSRPPVKTAS